MAAPTTTLKGRPACYNSRSYQGFTDDRTGESKPSGVTLSGWLVSALDQPPVELRFKAGDPDGVFAQFVVAVETGDTVVAHCALYARGKTINHVVTSLDTSVTAS